MSNFLHRLRANVYQVFINGHNAAILRQTTVAWDYSKSTWENIAKGANTVATEIWIEGAEAMLLATVPGTNVVDIAQRIAAGEFDNDFRFEISDEADEDGNYSLQQIATPSERELYASSMRDPYGFVQAERECQAERAEFPTLEERFDHYFEMGL